MDSEVSVIGIARLLRTALALGLVGVLVGVPARAGESRVSVERVEGNGRLATAAAVSAHAWDAAEVVLVARADEPADALSAAPLAGALSAPVLLTHRDRLADETAEEIARLGARRAVLLGGEEALAAEVAHDLEALGLQVERIAGPDRFATAAAVAARLPGGQVLLVRGIAADPAQAWPDAVAAAAFAAQTHRPVLLTATDALPAATRDALAGRSHVTVIGGGAAVSDALVEGLRADGLAVERLAGDTRFSTSAAVVEAARAAGADTRATWVATGRNFADALTAGPAAAAAGGTLLLIDGSRLNAEELGLDLVAVLLRPTTELTVIGGAAGVTEPVARALGLLAAGGPPGDTQAEVPDLRRAGAARRHRRACLE